MFAFPKKTEEPRETQQKTEQTLAQLAEVEQAQIGKMFSLAKNTEDPRPEKSEQAVAKKAEHEPTPLSKMFSLVRKKEERRETQEKMEQTVKQKVALERASLSKMISFAQKKPLEKPREIPRKKVLTVAQKEELAKFNLEFGNVCLNLVEAEKCASLGQLKTATLLQADGLLALTELRSHIDLSTLDVKTASQVEEHLEGATANFLELLSASGKLSAKLWQKVKEKDLNNAWSYKELPQLYEIFTLTDEIFYPEMSSDANSTKQQSQPTRQRSNQDQLPGAGAESLEAMQDLIVDEDIPPSKQQVLEAFNTLCDNPDDVEANRIVERFENVVVPPRCNSEELQKILNQPEHEHSRQFLRRLDRNGINFHQIYGYLPQKASMMHNVVMRTISIHRGFKREKGANPRFPHKGILLHGPSGTGKTQLIRAAATLLKDICMYFELTKSDLLTKWHGQSEQNLTKLFNLAELVGPSIIFIDEGEELFGKKDGEKSETSKNMASKLLSLMTDESRVLVVCATNSPWQMEESFRRRFTLNLHLGMPKEAERALILKHLLRRYFSLITDAQYRQLASLTDGMSGGDLEVIVYDVYNKREDHRIEAGFMQQCPIRSTFHDPVYVPCGPYAKRRTKVSPLAIAKLADYVEIAPITFSIVRAAIKDHTKTVPERLAQYHIEYSKNKDYKPPKDSPIVTHIHEKKEK